YNNITKKSSCCNSKSNDCSPIWYNNITPAIRTFIKKNCGKINSQIICFTTSTYNIDYSKNFRNYLERLGYKVLLNKSITKQNEKSGVKELIENIKSVLKSYV
ncbi:MAG: hypothetical protein QXX09_06400, partial [Candidatus Methanomethylicia archaeon]